ncbi:MAG: FecR family protein [Candidatus Cyclobacteriaceae bacterium M3_2C_046]
MEEIIIKYLNQNLLPEEELRLKAWLKEDKNNRQVFEHIVANWHIKQTEIQASQHNIYQRIIQTPIQDQIDHIGDVRGQVWKTWIKVAAILLIAITTSLVIFDLQQMDQKTELQEITRVEKKALPGQKLSFTLPDGSVVKLNSDSRLMAPQQFTNKSRQVFLEGEAFFEVTEDASRPFVVTTDDFKVKVLGTSFNIRSYQEEENSSVAVVSGKVMVSNSTTDQKTQEEVLTRNQMLVYSFNDQSWKKHIGYDHDLILGWRDQKLIFKNDRISTILNVLSRWYGKEFKVNAAIDPDREYTARFSNPTLKEVMESLSYNYQFNYEIEAENVIIK